MREVQTGMETGMTENTGVWQSRELEWENKWKAAYRPCNGTFPHGLKPSGGVSKNQDFKDVTVTGKQKRKKLLVTEVAVYEIPCLSTVEPLQKHYQIFGDCPPEKGMADYNQTHYYPYLSHSSIT